MENDLASLRLIDEEEIVFQEEDAVVDHDIRLNLVGRCLTNNVVYFPPFAICSQIIEVRRPSATSNKWLREANGLVCGGSILASIQKRVNLGGNRDSVSIQGSDLGTADYVPNLSHLRYNQVMLIKETSIWPNREMREPFRALGGIGPMDSDMDEENDPIHSIDGKKMTTCGEWYW
ncbi:hypothetical protein J1N35_037862 [Gossypium stocksii]|uniref:Uncharacterized protein n=1 Tax=Gossypium stocksii TaxID=47602 RepID=A0A9D3UL31_9ROSI|nr:hypothetical protein J1N35_037862 [Gossypium stocksii]